MYDEIRFYMDQGLNAKQVAIKVGKPYTTVWKRMKRMGYVPNKNNINRDDEIRILSRGGVSDGRIAYIYGLTRQRVQQITTDV